MFKKTSFVFSSRGSLTVQFLLGFVLSLSFMVIFGAVTFTLAITSITQYITYASSRSLFLSSGSFGVQKENAENKWRELKDKLVKSDGLIDISQVSLSRGEYLNRSFGSAQPNLFYGVWTKFLPKILKVETLWGNTTDDSVDFFETVVGSYLGREPSLDECNSFNKKRWDHIRTLHSRSGGSVGNASFPIPSSGSDQYYDNGC